jgi:hypothetical protein
MVGTCSISVCPLVNRPHFEMKSRGDRRERIADGQRRFADNEHDPPVEAGHAVAGIPSCAKPPFHTVLCLRSPSRASGGALHSTFRTYSFSLLHGRLELDDRSGATAALWRRPMGGLIPLPQRIARRSDLPGEGRRTLVGECRLRRPVVVGIAPSPGGVVGMMEIARWHLARQVAAHPAVERLEDALPRKGFLGASAYHSVQASCVQPSIAFDGRSVPRSEMISPGLPS